MKPILGSLLAAVLSISPVIAQAPVTSPASPQTPVAAPPASPQAATPTSDIPAKMHDLAPADLEAFFDGILPLQLERSDIAGASVLVWKDGNLLLEKGYGFADMKTRKPVDPSTTIFRLASISKLFTWVSVMQLVEQGKLNLDTDINQYLDFQIRPAFDKPITLRNLMTHTGGFEEDITNIILTDPKKAVSLRDDLIDNQPMRIYPPGQVPAYSNYGVGLASYIVQRASGEQFEQYVQNHIFNPLHMRHSSFYQPIPKELAAAVSEGYRRDTTKSPVGFELFNPVGAGGVSSSATDMGRFGHALLNGGELDGQRILKPETVAQMWTPQFRASDQLPPICMGFYEDWRNHLHWIGHEGDLIAFHSLFFIEPQQKLILFVSYNSAGGGNKPRPEIIKAFSDRYFPGAPPFTYMKKDAKELHDVEGNYISTRRSDSTKLRISQLGGQATVKVGKDGVLTVDAFKDLRGHTVKWKLVGKDLWQAEEDQQRIFFIRDNNGRVVRMAVDFPGVELERVPWYASSGLVMPTLCTSYGVLALVLIATLIRVGRRIFLRKRPPLVPQPGTIWLTFGPRAAAILWTLFIGGVCMYFVVKDSDLMPPTPEWYPWLSAMNWVTGVCLFFSILAVLAALRIWRHKELRWITKVKFSFVGAACAFLSYCALYYHWIGPANRL